MPLEEKNNRIKGIVSIILSAAGFAGMAFFVKLSGNVPVMEKAMFRNAVAAVVAYLIMRKEQASFYVEKKNRLSLFLRCFFGTTGLICNFWAIGYLKLEYFTENGSFFRRSDVCLHFKRKTRGGRHHLRADCPSRGGFCRKTGAGTARISCFTRPFRRILCGNRLYFCQETGKRGSTGSTDCILFFFIFPPCDIPLLLIAVCAFKLTKAYLSLMCGALCRCRADFCDESLLLCSGERDFRL